MINGIDTSSPIVPDNPQDGEDPDPIEDGNEPPTEVPAEDDPGSSPDDSIISSGSFLSGAWMIIPIAAILIVIGIGAYLFIMKSRK